VGAAPAPSSSAERPTTTTIAVPARAEERGFQSVRAPQYVPFCVLDFY
jgi:hypothetical protein